MCGVVGGLICWLVGLLVGGVRVCVGVDSAVLVVCMCVGWVVLALFADGLLRLVGVIAPIFPWLDISIK